MLIRWRHCPPTADEAYERMRSMLTHQAAETNGEGDTALSRLGCVREWWSCVDLPGMQVAKCQANPEQPLEEAEWDFVVRHFIDFPDAQHIEIIDVADSLEEAKEAGAEYVRAHIGYCFTTAFDSEYFEHPGRADKWRL
jgi:hypothetical protein